MLDRVRAVDPLHGRVHAEGAVWLVSDQPGDSDRAEGRGRRSAQRADRHRAVPLRVVCRGRSRRAGALRGLHGRRAAQRRRRDQGRARTTRCAGSSCGKAAWISSSTTWRPTSCTSCAAIRRCRSSRRRAPTTRMSASTCATRCCKDVRVRQALAYAVDRDAIVKHLRRGLARPAVGILPPMSWAFTPDVADYPHSTRQRPARCSTRRAIAIPTAPGPLPRLHLTLKVSSTEFNRLQSSVLQQDFARVGVALDVRTYEFATLYADVLKGNFQLFTLQWVGVSDPDMLRRVFHTQADAAERLQSRVLQQRRRWTPLIDEATVSNDDARRRALFADAQRLISRDVPYLSLWYKTNVAVARRDLTRRAPVAGGGLPVPARCDARLAAACRPMSAAGWALVAVLARRQPRAGRALRPRAAISHPSHAAFPDPLPPGRRGAGGAAGVDRRGHPRAAVDGVGAAGRAADPRGPRRSDRSLQRLGHGRAVERHRHLPGAAERCRRPSATPTTGSSTSSRTSTRTSCTSIDRAGWARVARGLFGRSAHRVSEPHAAALADRRAGHARRKRRRRSGGCTRATSARSSTPPARAGRLEPLDRVNGGLVDWPSGQGWYAYGARFHQYLARTYGPEQARANCRSATAGRLPFLTVRGLSDEVYGKSLGQLWKEFRGDASCGMARRCRPVRRDRSRSLGFLVDGPREAPTARSTSRPPTRIDSPGSTGLHAGRRGRRTRRLALRRRPALGDRDATCSSTSSSSCAAPRLSAISICTICGRAARGG